VHTWRSPINSLQRKALVHTQEAVEEGVRLNYNVKIVLHSTTRWEEESFIWGKEEIYGGVMLKGVGGAVRR
jgi:hypothetical protein